MQNIYSMMDRAYEKGVIPYCQEHNIGFVAFSPIASGYLSGKVDPTRPLPATTCANGCPS